MRFGLSFSKDGKDQQCGERAGDEVCAAESNRPASSRPGLFCWLSRLGFNQLDAAYKTNSSLLCS